jgi:O-antigen/teichoic acid export membrane protein
MASRVEISKRLLLINSASSIGAQVLQFSVLLWLQQHLLHRISPDEYVLYPLVMAIVGFVPLFTMILTSGLARYFVEAYALGDETRVSQIVSSMVPLLLGAGLLLMALGLVMAWYVDWILVIPKGLIWDARLMMCLLFFSLAVQLPCAPLGQGLYVRQKFVTTNLIIVCSEVIRTSVLLSLLLLVSTRVLWVVVAMFVSQMFALVVNMRASLRAMPSLRYRYQGIRWDLVRAVTGFGGWNFLLVLSLRTREYFVPLILNHLGSAVDVASYTLGSTGRRQVDQWFDVASRPIYPIITGMYSMGAIERFRNAYLRGGRTGLWAILLVVIPAVIYAEPVILLYAGATYVEAATVMALTLAGYVLSAGNWMGWGMAVARAQMRPLSFRVCLAQLLAVLGILLLTGWFGLGAIGAAVASFAAMVLSDVFLMLPICLRLAEVNLDTWIRKTLVPGLVPGCTAAVVWLSLNLLVKPDSWLELGWCTALGALCYAAVLLGVCLEPRDKQDLAMIFAKVRILLGGQRGCTP